MQVTTVPGVSSGLVPGDLVVGVAGRPLEAWLDAVLDPGLARAALDGPTVPYAVERNGVDQRVEVVLGPSGAGGQLLAFWSAVLFVLVLQGVAWYVLWRRPGEPAAVALAIAAAGVSGSTIPWLLGLSVRDITLGWPFLLYAATAGGLYMLLWPAGALHLPLALAERRLTRRSLAVVYGLPLGAYGLTLVATRLGSGSTLAWIGAWPLTQLVVIIPTSLAGAVLTVRGYRAASPSTRSRVRWVALGGAASVIASLALFWVPQLATGRPLVPWSTIGVVALALPLGVAAAIFRDRLFDLDVVVNRALVYGGATASIVALYIVLVTALGRVLGVEGGFSASLLATGLAAVAALPIRDVLQRGVNRLMYGDRDDPDRALRRLGRRLEEALDPLEAPSVIVRTVADSLRLPWVGLRIGGSAGGSRLVTHGSVAPPTPITVPLVYGSEVVGDLLVAPRSTGEPLSSADRRLLEALASQAGAAVHALALTLDLMASRERLVVAREEERRRIRRDLHDGLGPTLAAIGLRAELATDLVRADGEQASRVLEELRGEVAGALTDIRRLVDDLRPAALDELGLVGAIRAQADRLGLDPRIEVLESGQLPELPAAVEVAAYRISVEAMTNITRHAGAHRARVRIGLAATDGSLEVEVIDDGRGLPDQLRPGIGLASMRERAAEVGGECRIEANPDGGTRVVARLPRSSGGDR